MDLRAVLDIVSRTDTGQVRGHNEDALFIDPAYRFVVLADGMGGYNAGEVASSMATTLLGEALGRAFASQSPATRDAGSGKLYAHAVLEREIALVNQAILQAAQDHPQYSGMGTTLLVALFYDDTMTVAHIGDSRLYRLRGDEFQKVTRDHSLLQEQLDAGMIDEEQARHSHNRNLVTRALGIESQVEAEIHDYSVQPGDLYLLCSDGLNDMVEDQEIALTLATLKSNLELCASRLIEQANDMGGRDNISVILVKVKKAYPEAARGWRRWFSAENR